MRFSLLQERGALFNYPRSAPIAQLVEQLICNQWVGSSSLSGGPSYRSNILTFLMKLRSGVIAMSHIRYTIRRSGTYYYNRRVPSHAVSAYGHTSDKHCRPAH